MNVPKTPSPKSEAIKPWVWVIASGGGSTGLSSYSNTWIPWVLLGITIFGLVNLAVAYWYLLIKHPDRLQSEDYMKHRLGDNLQGQIPIGTPAMSANTAAPQVAQ